MIQIFINIIINIIFYKFVSTFIITTILINTFSNFYYSGQTNYDTASNYYSDTFIASGTVGTKLYYRVKNEKNYETLCGDFVTRLLDNI